MESSITKNLNVFFTFVSGQPYLLLLVLLELLPGFTVFLVQSFKLILRFCELHIKSFAESLSIQPVLLHVVDSFGVLHNTFLQLLLTLLPCVSFLLRLLQLNRKIAFIFTKYKMPLYLCFHYMFHVQFVKDSLPCMCIIVLSGMQIMCLNSSLATKCQTKLVRSHG